MNINFTKMHALGNNYIYINQMEEQIPEDILQVLAIEISNVRTGIGSDGMILICSSDHADIQMRVFNNDGSEAKTCGNGLRCVAKYVFEHAIVKNESFTIETLGGVVDAYVNVKDQQVYEVTIDMGIPKLTKSAIPMVGWKDDGELAIDATIEIDDRMYTFTGVSMGNPHAVLFVDDVNTAPISTLGPLIEKHPLFPEWTNVEFVRVLSNGELDFRVWERGSGITYACGTGACAAVVAAVAKGKVQKNQNVTVHLLGGDLDIIWKDNDHVWMTGSAEYICHGIYRMKDL